MTQENAGIPRREADAPMETVGRAERMRRALAARSPGTYGEGVIRFGSEAVSPAVEGALVQGGMAGMAECAALVVKQALTAAVDAVGGRGGISGVDRTSEEFVETLAAELGRAARTAYDAFMAPSSR